MRRSPPSACPVELADANAHKGATATPPTDRGSGATAKPSRAPPVLIAVSADERSALAQLVLEELATRGHEALLHGALAEDERSDWAWCSAAVSASPQRAARIPSTLLAAIAAPVPVQQHTIA